MKSITYLSPPLEVHMADAWFDIATPDHFWIKRRFEVFRGLWKAEAPIRVAEIGCGHGLVLGQIGEMWALEADGYDLNEPALRRAQGGQGQLFCYNIHDRNEALKQAYDTIFLFDVIEHLEDDKGFVESVLFHLKPGGRLVINVPAFHFLFSKYDKVVGHQRRYDIGMLQALGDAVNLRLETWSYWGLFYIPILLIRQQMVKNLPDSKVARQGFAASSRLMNWVMLLLGRMDFVPDHWAGTSVMAIFRQVP